MSFMNQQLQKTSTTRFEYFEQVFTCCTLNKVIIIFVFCFEEFIKSLVFSNAFEHLEKSDLRFSAF